MSEPPAQFPVPVQAGVTAVHCPDGLHRSALSPLSMNPPLHPKEQVVFDPKAPRRWLQDMVPCSGAARAGHRAAGRGAAGAPAVRKRLHLQSPKQPQTVPEKLLPLLHTKGGSSHSS